MARPVIQVVINFDPNTGDLAIANGNFTEAELPAILKAAHDLATGKILQDAKGKLFIAKGPLPPSAIT